MSTSADTIPANAARQAILERYEAILMNADRLFQEYVLNHSLKITCGPACSECCVYDVPVSFIDAYYLQLGMQTLESRKKHEIRLNAVKNVPKIKRLERIAEAIEERSGGAVQDAIVPLSRILKHKTKCSFVGGKGCLVYKYRPLIGRLFGVPLQIWENDDEPCWCKLNTPNITYLPVLNALKLQEEVEKLSRELEMLLTGKIQPEFPIWFFAIFPVKKFIEKNVAMTDRKLYSGEQKFKVRQRLVKMGGYSMPAVVTVLAVEEE
jgi:hypothetical protein